MNRFYRALRLVAPWIALVALGCSSTSSTAPTAPEPPTKMYPVAGKVVYADGSSSERLERGKVWFQSTSDASLLAVGTIGDDGSFQMTALYPDLKTFAGVPAGSYKVRIDPPLDDERVPQTQFLAARYSDFNRSGYSVSVPVDGEVTFSVARR